MADSRPWLAIGLTATLPPGCSASTGLSAGDHAMTRARLDPPFEVNGAVLVDGDDAERADVARGTQIVASNAADGDIAYWSEDVSSAQLAADLQHLLSE